MRYEKPPHLDHAAADQVLEQALVKPEGVTEAEADKLAEEQAVVLIGLALSDDDREFVEAWCLRIGRGAPDLWLRGQASLCIGHLARGFGMVSEDAARLVRELEADPDARAANSNVIVALDDLNAFAGREAGRR